MNPSERATPRLSAASIHAPRTSLVIAWQLIVIVAVAAWVLDGPVRWALCAVALTGAVLITVRWHHRLAYEWVRSAGTFWRVSHRQQRRDLPPIDVAAVRTRGGNKAALLHDGSGFAVVLSVESPAGALEPIGLGVDVLVGLAEASDPVVSAVQLVMHADCPPSASKLAIAVSAESRQNVPRSQTTWVALRHDPMASGYAVSAVGASPAVCASIARTLSARGQRAVQSLSSRGLQAELLTADAARDVFDEALVTGSVWKPEAEPAVADGVIGADGADSADGGPASGGPGRLWSSWDSDDTRHITYRLRRWPAAGVAALQRELTTGTPFYSVTTAVTVTRTPDGQPATTGTVRVTFDPEIAWSGMDRRVHQAATACGASLVPLHGEHAAGVLATLPLGREPGRPDRRRASRRGTVASSLADRVPVTTGGLVIGTDPSGAPVAIPLFRAGRGTRVCVAGKPGLSMLLALRAIGAGARVQVVTTRSAGWLRLRDQASVETELMPIVEPGAAPPPNGSRAAPWVVIADTGSPPGLRGAWQADIAAAPSIPMVPGALHGLDAILFEQASPAEEALVIAAFGLGADFPGRLGGTVPDRCVTVVLPGSARIARLLPTISR